MKNEYGEELDRNGYAHSIIQKDVDHCFLCGRCDQKLDRHEPFNGAYRQKSKRLGMWVTLCGERCHHGKAHSDAGTAFELKRIAQLKAMSRYEWSTKDFVREFGKNWL